MLVGIDSFADIAVDRATRGVSGIIAKSNIANQVAVGEGCEAAVCQAGEGPLVVPPSDMYRLRMGALPDGAPVVSLQWVFKDRVQQAGITQGGPLAEIGVVVLPAAAPARPAPNMGVP